MDITLQQSDKPNTKMSLEILERIVKQLKINKGIRTAIISQIKVAKVQIEKNRPWIANIVLGGLTKQIRGFSSNKLITQSDGDALIQIIEQIRASLI